jgi:GT2 family glycosyltransferase
MPHVYIGIVTYNSSKDLSDCLVSIQSQTYENWSLTVFDNASTDDSVNIVRRTIPAANIIENDGNLGFGRAHNSILSVTELAPGDFYLPLNPNVILAPTYVEELIKFLSDSTAGWVTGKLLMLDEKSARNDILYSTGHGLLHSGYAFNIGQDLPDSAAFSRPCEVFGAPGAAPIYRQEFIADLIDVYGEFFDTHMFMYNEDIDLDWRARLLGWRCWFVPAAVAYHARSHLSLQLISHSIANRYLSSFKNAFLADLIAYTMPILIGHLLFRLVVTPKEGFALLRLLGAKLPAMVRKRIRPRVARREMLYWFRWSALQPTKQPMSLRERFISFKDREKS